jgi:hypothetical protein
MFIKLLELQPNLLGLSKILQLVALNPNYSCFGLSLSLALIENKKHDKLEALFHQLSHNVRSKLFTLEDLRYSLESCELI